MRSFRRLYAIQDANFNVTAVVDDTGDVVERYRFAAYGQRTVLTPAFALDADGLSDVAFQVGHQGMMHDAETGLVYNRARMLHVVLGRFVQRDPLGYVDGMNVYQYVRSRPFYGRDPYGLCCDCDKLKEEKKKCRRDWDLARSKAQSDFDLALAQAWEDTMLGTVLSTGLSGAVTAGGAGLLGGPLGAIGGAIIGGVGGAAGGFATGWIMYDRTKERLIGQRDQALKQAENDFKRCIEQAYKTSDCQEADCP